MRLTHGTNVVLLLLLWLASMWAFPRLPEHVPIHFGVSGAADRWANTSTLAWFGLPLIATGLTAMTFLFARLLPSRPTWINLPRKDRYLALPDHRKRPVLTHVQRLLWGSNALVLVVFCIVQVASYRAAHGDSSQGLMLAVLLLAALTTPIILGVWIPPIQREVDHQFKAYEDEQKAGTGHA